MRPRTHGATGVLLLAALLAAGCAPLLGQKPGASARAPAPPAEAPQVAAPVPTPEPDPCELLYRRLTELLVRPEGTAPDFAGALRELDAYVELNPAERQNPRLQSLAAPLREVQRLDGEHRVALGRVGSQAGTITTLQQQVERLAAENAGNKAALERLARENRELKAVVERLKALEMSMEEKRKKVR